MTWMMEFLLVVSAAAGAARAAVSWEFVDGAVVGRDAETGEKRTGRIGRDGGGAVPRLELTTTEPIRVTLRTKEGTMAKRPHQAMLLVTDASSTTTTAAADGGGALSAPFLLDVKPDGTARVEIRHADIPEALRSMAPRTAAATRLRADVLLASFGSADPLLSERAFDLAVSPSIISAAASGAPADAGGPARYGRRPEIHHVFRDDPKQQPLVLSLFFLAAVVATLPALVTAWVAAGANLARLPLALRKAPISHPGFFGALAAIEGVFFLYYRSWNLFQMLPVVAALGAVAILCGIGALGELQSGRLAGLYK